MPARFLLAALAGLLAVAALPANPCGPYGCPVPCGGSYFPAGTYTQPACPSYARPTYQAPACHEDTHYGHADYGVYIADAFFPVFDVNVKDVFIFTGPPLAIPHGAVVGINGAGQEVRAAAAQPQAPSPLPVRPLALNRDLIRAIVSEDEAWSRSAPPAWGGEELPRAQAAAPAEQSGGGDLALATASLNAGGCAACHTGGRSKGDFVIFSAPGQLAPGLNWKAVLSNVSSPDGRSAPRMPPTGKGAYLTAGQVDPIRRLAQ